MFEDDQKIDLLPEDRSKSLCYWSNEYHNIKLNQQVPFQDLTELRMQEQVEIKIQLQMDCGIKTVLLCTPLSVSCVPLSNGEIVKTCFSF